jgi:hypothetical protein
MPVYVLVGKLGGGKTVTAVTRAMDYLRAGRPVATNIDLQPDKVLRATARYRLTRLPDFPTAEDMWDLGIGNETTDEEKNGLVVLDEGVFFLNARTWNDKGRERFIEWCVMSRKQGWDVMLLIQSFSALDKQVREMIGEHVVTCRRLDRVKVAGVKLPRLFMASVRYGSGPNAPVIDRWLTRGTDIFAAFPTRQVFRVGESSVGMHCMLDAWYLRGRFLTEWQIVKGKFWFLVVVFSLLAFLAGGGIHKAYVDHKSPPSLPEKAEVIGYVITPSGVSVTLASGDSFFSSAFSFVAGVLRVEFNGFRYVEKPIAPRAAGV